MKSRRVCRRIWDWGGFIRDRIQAFSCRLIWRWMSHNVLGTLCFWWSSCCIFHSQICGGSIISKDCSNFASVHPICWCSRKSRISYRFLAWNWLARDLCNSNNLICNQKYLRILAFWSCCKLMFWLLSFLVCGFWWSRFIRVIYGPSRWWSSLRSSFQQWSKSMSTMSLTMFKSPSNFW